MPWREMESMELRLEFVRECASGVFTMTELADHYGISRKTAYKWIDRYQAEGAEGLADRSRRPHHSPQATPDDVVDAIVALRRRYPRWGPKKLLAVLRRRQPTVRWPSRSAVGELLAARGLVAPRRTRLRVPATVRPLHVPTGPNVLWTTDFKGEFRTGDGRYCYPLTLRDGFSRFVLRCDALRDRTTVHTRPCFQRAFAAYGLPERIRSDNGAPFARPGLAGLSRLSVWWIRLGIVPERIAPGHPEQNGSHEQFHAVLKAATTRPPGAHARAATTIRGVSGGIQPRAAARSLARRYPRRALPRVAAAAPDATAAARVSRPCRGATRQEQRMHHVEGRAALYR